MQLSDLDGFLTAIVIGPEPILPSEWLPVVWGSDEPDFENAEQAERVLGLILGRDNEIIRLGGNSGRSQAVRSEVSD